MKEERRQEKEVRKKKEERRKMKEERRQEKEVRKKKEVRKMKEDQMKRRSEKRRERLRGKKMQREKVKSRNILFFQWFMSPEGRKVGSLKRWVRSHLARWEMKNCTPLWPEAHFEVKTYKTHHSRNTFGSWDDGKVHAVVARSTFPSQNVKHTTCSHHFWRFRCGLRGRREGFCTLPKVSKTWGCCCSFKSVGRRGTFEEDLERCISRGRRSTRDIFIRDVTRSGCWFPEKGCILEHQIFRFAEMILRDRCSTSYDLASLFRGRRSTLDRWSGKNRKTNWYEAVSSALNFPFLKEASQNCFVFDVQLRTLRKSRRLVSFLMLSTSKIEEVLQNCFVFKLAERQTDRQTDR